MTPKNILEEIEEKLKRIEKRLNELKENKNPLTKERIEELFMQGWNKGYNKK
jgi:hypothetical protein